MPKEMYGDAQVREIKLTRTELVSIALQHIKLTMDKPYDFDYERPIIMQEPDGGLTLRYVQQTITQDRESRQITFKSLDEVIAKKAKGLTK